MPDRSEILNLLEEYGIPYELSKHLAVFNIEEISKIELPYPDRIAKNLFIQDDKKRNYTLLTVMGHQRVDLKEFRKAQGTRALSFASSEDLFRFLKLTPGAVTPLGLLNDNNHSVRLFLDASFLEGNGKIGVHPNDNTATVWLNTNDQIRLLRTHGTTIQTVHF